MRDLECLQEEEKHPLDMETHPREEARESAVEAGAVEAGAAEVEVGEAGEGEGAPARRFSWSLAGLLALGLVLGVGYRSIVLYLVVLVAVGVHELGHLFVGRWRRVGFDEYSIGIGAEVAALEVGEHKFTLRSLPLGGYVRLRGLGESDPTSEWGRAGRPSRVGILLAGIGVNLVVGVGAGMLALCAVGAPVAQTYVAGGVLPAGVSKGDVVTGVGVDGVYLHKVAFDHDSKYYVEHGPTLAKGVDVVSVHDGKVQAWRGDVVLGGRVEYRRMDAGAALREVGNLMYHAPANQVLSILGRSSTGEWTIATLQGVNAFDLLMLLCVISFSLAAFNLLPVPPLDGGKAVVALWRRPNTRLVTAVSVVGGLAVVYVLFVNPLVLALTR